LVDTYYLLDLLEPFCPEVEFAGAVVLAPPLDWLFKSSLLLGFVSDAPGGSFRFSVKRNQHYLAVVKIKLQLN